MIVLDRLKLSRFAPKIAAIEQLLQFTLKQIETISSQSKFNQT
jgi:hypothetical protein